MIFTKQKFSHRFDFCQVCTDISILEGLSGDVLLCIFSGIIPKNILDRFIFCYNFHPGPENYPGRDPHHWAIFEASDWFGVTVHHMLEKVDEGDIIFSERFRIRTSSPHELKDEANERAIRLLNEIGPALVKGTYHANSIAPKWSGIKRSRKDTIEMALSTKNPAFEGFF